MHLRASALLAKRRIAPYGLAKAGKGRLSVFAAARLAREELKYLPREVLDVLCEVPGVELRELFEGGGQRRGVGILDARAMEAFLRSVLQTGRPVLVDGRRTPLGISSSPARHLGPGRSQSVRRGSPIVRPRASRERYCRHTPALREAELVGADQGMVDRTCRFAEDSSAHNPRDSRSRWHFLGGGRRDRDQERGSSEQRG
jgi:hypothetical protein